MKKPSFIQRHASRESFPLHAHGLYISFYALVVGAMIGLSLLTGYQSGWTYGLRVFLVFSPLWFFAAIFALLGPCHIVVDDMAISKRIFGYTREKIFWDELDCVKVRLVHTQTGPLTIFVLEQKSVTASTAYKCLWFTNEVHKLSRLVGIINRLLVKRNIPVYDERFGKTNQLPLLPLMLAPYWQKSWNGRS